MQHKSELLTQTSLSFFLRSQRWSCQEPVAGVQFCAAEPVPVHVQVSMVRFFKLKQEARGVDGVQLPVP